MKEVFGDKFSREARSRFSSGHAFEMLCLFLESSVVIVSIYRFDVKIRKVIVGLSLLFVFFLFT